MVRRQFFAWSQIESDDYPTYIANLREIGCPEATVRDIILADVNQLYGQRRATEVVTANQQWWLPDPDPAVTKAAIDKIMALDGERRALLTRLLGPDWESADYPLPSLASLSVLDGPVLGTLPPSTKLALQRIEQASMERQNAYSLARQAAGQPLEPAELARLRQETRAELAGVLTPEQLDEYLLRYSHNATLLRDQMRGFTTTPEQFRNLFHALDPIDQALQLLAGKDDPVSEQRRADLDQQKTTVLSRELGEDGYQDYVNNQDPRYREARAIAEASGVDRDKILPIATLNNVTEQEIQRIQKDTSLTSEEQSEQIEAANSARQSSLQRLLGDAAYERYVESQSSETEP